MKRNVGIAGCLVCAFSMLNACGVEEVADDPSGTSPKSSALPKSGKATLRILLHDKPTASADEVWVKFDKVSANHETQGWLTVSDKVKAVDLLKLQNGVVEEIGLAELPAGNYDEVRLHLVDAWVIVGGAKEALKVPSGMQSGLKIKTTLTMPECGTVTMTLDWDAGAHLVKNKGQGWILRPVIVVESVTTDDGACSCDFGAVTRLNGLPTPRGIMASTVVLDGKAYILGGARNPLGSNWPYDANVFEFDVATDSYRDLGAILPYGLNIKPYNVARADNGKYYSGPVIGPTQQGGWGSHRCIIEFDPATRTATEKACFGYSRIWEMGAINGGDGFIYFIGGWTGGMVNKIWRYDPVADSITEVVSNAGSALNATTHGLIRASNGRIYIVKHWLNPGWAVFDPKNMSVRHLASPTGGSPIVWEAPKGTLWAFGKNHSQLIKFDIQSEAFSTVELGANPYGNIAPHTFSVDYATGKLYAFGGEYLDGSHGANLTAAVFRHECLVPTTN